MTSEAQKRARDKWDAKHPENKRYRVAKSTAKRFVGKLAKINDLNMIDKLSRLRRDEIVSKAFEKITDTIMEIENQLVDTKKVNFITNDIYIDYDKKNFFEVGEEEPISYSDVIIDVKNQLNRDLKNTINVFDREHYIEILDDVLNELN